MRNNSLALYVGCAALVIGALGLTARSAFDAERLPEPAGALLAPQAATPLYMQAASARPAVQSPGMAGVPFYAEMVELLTPRTAVMARDDEVESSPPPPKRRDVARQTKKDNAREATKQSRQKSKTAATRKKREQPAAEPRQEVEVVVHDRFKLGSVDK